MNMLIADCGSTKCDWRLLTGADEVAATQTAGFNPSYMNPDTFLEAIRSNAALKRMAQSVSVVHFYGSGCSSVVGKDMVREVLSAVFTEASLHVHSDMLGAALAVYRGEPVICGILGTGSNSCRFDGEKMSHCAPSLGYILGDEGSGNQLGQALLRHYFYNSMPALLHMAFHQKYHPELDVLIQRVYREPRPNTFLASFAAFAVEHRTDPWIQQLAEAEFRRFMHTFVCGFADYRLIKTGFVGSIAHHFEQLLRTTANDMGINVSLVLQKPIDGLVDFHRAAG